MDTNLMSPLGLPSIGTPHHGMEDDQMINPQAQQAQQSQSQNRAPAYSFGGPDFSTPQSLLASGTTPQNLGWRSMTFSALRILSNNILGDKMNLTIRLGKQFPESSPCLPRQLGTGQQGRYTNGTLIKQFT